MSSYLLKTAPPKIILRALLDPSRMSLGEEVLEILLWHQQRLVLIPGIIVKQAQI